MNHSVHKPSRWIVDSNPCDFRANNNPHLAICASTLPSARNLKKRSEVENSRDKPNTQMPTHLLPARSCSIIRIQCLTNRINVIHNVVTVKGSHRALLWVFSVSGKYNRIFSRYPNHRCSAATCPNTSKATRKLQWRCAWNFWNRLFLIHLDSFTTCLLLESSREDLWQKLQRRIRLWRSSSFFFHITKTTQVCVTVKQ